MARANFERAGLADRIELREGPALPSLSALVREAAGAFDLVFIDADKRSNPGYFAFALARTSSADPRVQGVRRFAELIAAEPRLVATALQTVGVEGWDGLVMALVVEPGAQARDSEPIDPILPDFAG